MADLQTNPVPVQPREERDEMRERTRERYRRRYAANRDKIRERQRRYVAANREKIREQQRLFREKLRGPPRKWPDLTGQTFGRLVVVEQVASDPRGQRRWRCECSCGGTTVTRTERLQRGLTKSCGCLTREAVSARSRTHGLSKTPEYSTWFAMIRRCTDPENPGFGNYGGRGITVCAQWLESSETFFADMGRRPSPNHSLDRIDNDGNYEPSNCRWATRSEQNRNQRPRARPHFHTPETRAKMATAHRQRWANPDYKERVRASLKRTLAAKRAAKNENF